MRAMFESLDPKIRGTGTSLLDFIKYTIKGQASTEGMTLSMKAATFAAKALNLALSMAVGALIGMAINGVISAIADYAQRIDTAATKTKEEADAANNATSSLKDLVNAYEELGDKSGWNTEDFDQAKDIQEELLALAKEQGTLDENKVSNLDLQNGKYEEQLGLLEKITEEQLKASESKLIQSKDAQGNKLIKTTKDNNRSQFFSSVSANTNRGIMNELKDAGIDVFNKNGSFGAKDLNDPDSIAKYYSELGKALDYIIQNTTEAQRAAGGAYHTVYQYLMDEQAALQDDADAYNDSTDAVNENVNARRKLQAIDFWSDGKSNGMDVSYSFDKVNTNKEITLSPTQVNITQENNSQVIPFEMPRYYDGVDLMSMTIQIHYVNANNAENYTAPINVSYSTDKIRFYWMVSNYATIKEGVLKFEIMATGAITVPNSGESKNYLWRTKPNEKLNVLKSLTGTAMTDPTGDDWYTQFLATMSQKVGEAQTAATQAAQSAQEAQAVVDGLADTLASYYTKEEVDGFVTLLRDDIAKVDGLAKFDVQYDAETQTIKFLNGEKVIKTITLNTDPSADWVTAFNKTVEAKIDEKIAPVKTELTEYKTSNDAAVKNLQDSVGNLPETLQSDYYNKQAINKLLEAKAEKTSVETVANDLTVVKNTASGLQNSIDTINGDISEIQEQLKNVKPDPNSGREYDITYEDSKLSLLENGTVKTQVVIQGGGGGGTGGSTSVIKIERLDGSALTVVAGDPAIINFKFSSVDNSGDDTGSATGVWYVGNTKVGTQTVIQGKNSFDATQYLHSGDNTVKLQVTDSVGSVGTKTWTVNVVEFYLESSFDDTLVYSGEVTFRYTPYGNITKTINFTIDGKILGSTTSSVTGRQLTYAIPAQTHGAHLVEVSMTAEINGKQVTSNKVVKDIMWAAEGNTTPIISCATKTASAKQYSNVAISYTVYDPSSSTTTVTLEVDGAKTATLTVGRTMQTWTWKSADIGTHTLKIVCGSVSKEISVEIKELGITIEPVKTNLAFDFNPAGKTNADETRLWSDGNW